MWRPVNAAGRWHREERRLSSDYVLPLERVCVCVCVAIGCLIGIVAVSQQSPTEQVRAAVKDSGGGCGGEVDRGKQETQTEQTSVIDWGVSSRDGHV